MILYPRLRFVPLLLLLLAGCASQGSGIGSGKTGGHAAQALGTGPLTPEKLLNVAPDAFAARLGAPGFKRREPGAEIWQYGGRDCSLFIYFYRNEEGDYASSYVDARKRAGGPEDVAACLASLPGPIAPIS